MEFKGTKTQWNVRGNFRCLEVVSSYGSICAIARQSSIDSNIDSQAEANAKLISKAPEMLQMLKDILYNLENEEEPFDENKIYNLIKEATEI